MPKRKTKKKKKDNEKYKNNNHNERKNVKQNKNHKWQSLSVSRESQRVARDVIASGHSAKPSAKAAALHVDDVLSGLVSPYRIPSSGQMMRQTKEYFSNGANCPRSPSSLNT